MACRAATASTLQISFQLSLQAAKRWGRERERCSVAQVNDSVVSGHERESERRRHYVAYYRVSTQQQGRSGLGLEAQREMVRGYLKPAAGELLAEFDEVGSGRGKTRPQLNEALRLCRLTRATLMIARLDRLSRNAGMIAELMESGLDFVVADFPQATRLTIHILAAVADYEWRITSERIKAALAAAKARGVALGGGRPPTPEQTRVALDAAHAAVRAQAAARARDLAPIVWPMVAKGMSPTGIAEELNRLGVPSSRNGRWHASSVILVLRATRPEFADSPEIQDALALGSVRLRAKLRAEALAPLVWSLRDSGHSTLRIADELNRQGIETPRRTIWRSAMVWKLLQRTETSFHAIGETFTLKRVQTTKLRAEARARKLAPVIWALRAQGRSTRQIAADLNEQGVKAPRKRWWGPAIGKIMRQTAEEFGGETAARKPPRQQSQLLQSEARAKIVAPLIWEMLSQGMSKEAIAGEMNRRGVPTARGRRWHHNTVRRVLELTAGETPPNEDTALALTLGSKAFQKLQRAKLFAPIIAPLRAAGWTYDAIAGEFGRLGVQTPRAGIWRGSAVWKLHHHHLPQAPAR
jgi:DNA invertase Pin-like site-specific DNA recombinase